MSELTKLQAPIDIEIVNSMIESTPEEWTEIVLILTRINPKYEIGDFTHELYSPEGFPPVAPVESLFIATFKLDKLLQAHGGFIGKATYSAKFTEGNWSYTANFGYLPSTP